MASQTVLPMVEKAKATIYRYKGRRFLTKRGAYMAKARDILGAEHVVIDPDDIAIGAYCACDLCEDMQDGYRKTRALAKQLAAEDRAAHS